jgi:hypothetical protein
MLNIYNAIVVTSQMMAIFFCAFFVVYLLARALLPLERGLSKFVWDHRNDPLKPVTVRGSFRAFSQRHNH